MSTFVLVHGSWHGGWCWEKVVPILERAGHKTVAPGLPGHGSDHTPAAQKTITADARPQVATDIGEDRGHHTTVTHRRHLWWMKK